MHTCARAHTHHSFFFNETVFDPTMAFVLCITAQCRKLSVTKLYWRLSKEPQKSWLWGGKKALWIKFPPTRFTPSPKFRFQLDRIKIGLITVSTEILWHEGDFVLQLPQFVVIVCGQILTLYMLMGTLAYPPIKHHVTFFIVVDLPQGNSQNDCL